MQYNIFRVKDKNGLLKEMMKNNYIKSKVEKQVDFLNVNLEYVGVTSNICQIDSDNNVIGGNLYVYYYNNPVSKKR